MLKPMLDANRQAACILRDVESERSAVLNSALLLAHGLAFGRPQFTGCLPDGVHRFAVSHLSASSWLVQSLQLKWVLSHTASRTCSASGRYFARGCSFILQVAQPQPRLIQTAQLIIVEPA
jgi:hypothetical protein